MQVGRPIPPRPVAAGEPLLTMRTIDSLLALGEWAFSYHTSVDFLLPQGNEPLLPSILVAF